MKVSYYPSKSRLVIVLLTLALGGCGVFGLGSTPVYGEIPECELLIPPQLKAPVDPAPMPQDELWPDGREKAEPWQQGWLEQTGQLDKANERPAAIDHIYSGCLQMHRNALKKAKRGFFGRLFG